MNQLKLELFVIILCCFVYSGFTAKLRMYCFIVRQIYSSIINITKR